jgi:hypothetical protein
VCDLTPCTSVSLFLKQANNIAITTSLVYCEIALGVGAGSVLRMVPELQH